jgi:hypothetical protein
MSPITTPTYGAFEANPARFTDEEAWVLVHNTWREIGAYEVRFGAAVLSKEKYEKTYGTLPALPKRAFAA